MIWIRATKRRGKVVVVSTASEGARDLRKAALTASTVSTASAVTRKRPRPSSNYSVGNCLVWAFIKRPWTDSKMDSGREPSAEEEEEEECILSREEILSREIQVPDRINVKRVRLLTGRLTDQQTDLLRDCPSLGGKGRGK